MLNREDAKRAKISAKRVTRGFPRAFFATLVLHELMDDRGSGRDILHHRLVPLLDRVEGFVRASGAGTLDPRLSSRTIVLEIASGILLHAAAGPLRSALWRTDHDPVALVRALFFDRPKET